MVQNFKFQYFPEKGNPGMTNFVPTAFIITAFIMMNAMGTEWVTPWILRMQKRLFLKIWTSLWKFYKGLFQSEFPFELLS